jgi:ABC-type transporter Mla subunit MlaD
MVDSKIVKVIGNLDVPIKQKADGTLYTFDPAVSPAEGTTTANGLATTVIDTTRTEPNDHWNNMALLITSGAQNGQVREITDWDLGTGTFTVAPAFGGAVLAGVTYKVLTNLPADIDVAAIEAKLDDATTGLAALKDLIDAVEGKLDDPVTGLANLKVLVDAVEGKLDDATTGLAALKTLIDAVEGKLDDPAIGLANLKVLIDALEGKLDDAGHGLAALKTLIDAVEGKLDDPAHGLANLKTLIDALEGKLDDASHGLAALKTLIDAVEGKLDDPATGLANLKTLIDDLEAKLDDAGHGLAALKTLIDAIEGKLDDATFGLSALKDLIDAVEGKLDARLDATVSSRALEAGGNVAAILTDTSDMQPRVPRILCSMDFWGDIIEELQLTSALQANLALAGADVEIAGLPAGITLVRAVVMFMCRAIENTNQAANKLQGAQNIEVNFEGGGFVDAINWADDLFAVALSTREMGTVMIGDNDVKATVTGDGTCTFRIDAARADQDNLNFNDFQIGIRVYFTV